MLNARTNVENGYNSRDIPCEIRKLRTMANPGFS